MSAQPLRAIVARLAETCDDVDVFPVPEAVAEHPGAESPEVVEELVRRFLAVHGLGRIPPRVVSGVAVPVAIDDEICEEALLEAFAP